MFCMNCGTKNDDDSVFCMNCGARLEESTKEATQVQRMNPEVPSTQSMNPVIPLVTSVPGGNIPPHQRSTSVNVAQEQPVRVAGPTQEGCVSAAWHDIKSSPRWFKKILFMGLCNLIPFMSLGTIGFAQQWGVEVAKGKRETMPSKIFNNKSFLSGLFEYVTWTTHGFLYMIAAIIISTLFFVIPVLNVLVGVAVFIFTWLWNSYVALASMRTSLNLDLGDCFRVKEILPVMKRRFGGAFCAFFIPSILCGVICVGVIVVLLLIFVPIILGIAGSATSSMYSSSYSNPLAAASNVGNVFSAIVSSAQVALVFVVIGVLLICFVSFFMSVLEKLLRYRAIGHWIANYAPEWAEQKEAHVCEKN